jgi:hypothetical protein
MVQVPVDWLVGAGLFLLLCLYSRWLTVRKIKDRRR